MDTSPIDDLGAVLAVVVCICGLAWEPGIAAAIPATTSAVLPTSLPKAEVYANWPFGEAEARRRQNETADKLGLPVETRINLPGDVDIELRLIPAGQFIMGSPDSEKLRGSLETQHPVRITKEFYLAKHVVTQAQWRAVMGTNPSLFKTKPDSDRRPVEHVSFNMIENDFLPRLQKLAPPGWTVRLPSEAEWEYACRAGSSTSFFFGDRITPDRANYDGTRASEGGTETVKSGQTTAVGAFPANPWGLCDMSGNVMQWCRDTYGDYRPKSLLDDPCNDAPGPGRVLRGGCWIHGPKFCRSAARYFAAPEYLAGSIGFRLVLAPSERSARGEN